MFLISKEENKENYEIEDVANERSSRNNSIIAGPDIRRFPTANLSFSRTQAIINTIQLTYARFVFKEREIAFFYIMLR